MMPITTAMRLRLPRLLVPVLAIACAAVALPASASALTLHIVNESGNEAKKVFVDITGDDFHVPGFKNGVPVPLSSIPNGEVTIEKLISGRVYISYDSGVREVEPESEAESIAFLTSPTRFDWAELTVNRPEPGTEALKQVEEEEKAAKSDVANLTAVNQFAIGMRLTTFAPGGGELESLGSTNANTIFDAMQQIPGGPQSTIRGKNGEILRVLSPDTPGSDYPSLSEYVHSMAGQSITLHTAFESEPFINGEFSGTFEPDGSITLTGYERVEGVLKKKPTTIHFEGQKLIEDIYTGDETPNTFEGAVRRDVLAGFSLGLWGGKYGNDALSFCTPNTTFQGTWCPSGFTVPAFAEARTTPPPFMAYEGYAGVIAQYSDIYGAPYSDASKKVQIPIDAEHVGALQLTILPDSPPSGGGNSGGGSSSSPSSSPAGSSGKPAPVPPASQATFKLPKVAKWKHGKLMAGAVQCQGACGRVVALLSPVRGKGPLAREAATVHKPKAALVLKPTKGGKKLLDAGKVKRAKLTVSVTQPGHSSATRTVTVRVVG
jgi:hypothetical protein